MSFGAGTNTRWLWFITYILLPLNVIGQIFMIFWLLAGGQGGMGLVFILAELCLAIATFFGLHQQKPWGWYFIMVMFGIQLIGTPLKVHAKASIRYDITQAANSLLQSQGRSPLSTAKPSLFDFEPMLAFILLLSIWTIPNALYMYRRRNLFGAAASSCVVPERDLAISPQSVSTATMNGVVADKEGLAYSVATNDTALYAQAMRECTENLLERDAGLWAKAFSMCEGDESKTKAKYIALRAASLAASHLHRQRDDVLKRRLENRDLIRKYPHACGSCEHFRRRDSAVQYLGECLKHGKSSYMTWDCSDYHRNRGTENSLYSDPLRASLPVKAELR